MKRLWTRTAATALLAASFSASAHFQLIHNPESMFERGGKVTFKMPFTHPASSGHVMEMPQPEQLLLVHKGKEKDLTASLKEITWTSAENTGKAYEAQIKLRSMGDYILALTPAPYYEKSEDIYIQQLTKQIVNLGSLPTDWDSEIGLATEIVPLTPPYALFPGGTFVGVVKANGKPVAGAEIEVEFMNYAPDMAANKFAEQAHVAPPFDVYTSQQLRTDANGTFVFGIPKAGYWGFAALGSGPAKEYKGKELSQDAVIWVHAREIK